MSRAYHMRVIIEGYVLDKEAAIIEAANQRWNLENGWDCCGGTMSNDGESWLTGGESEEEFADRMSIAIWKANGQGCEVTIHATYLDELPYEIHYRGEDNYDSLMKPNDTLENALDKSALAHGEYEDAILTDEAQGG